MRLAGDEQHAQAVAHGRNRQHGDIVARRQLARALGDFKFDHCLARMIERHVEASLDADRHRLAQDFLAADPQGDHRGRRIAEQRLIGAEVVDPEGDAGRLTDDAVARGVDQHDLAVGFVRRARCQKMHGRFNIERARGVGGVGRLAVGDDKDAGKALARRIGKGLAQRIHGAGFIGAAKGQRIGLDAERFDALAQLFCGVGRDGVAVVEGLAGAFINQNEREVVQRRRLRFASHRIGEERQHYGDGQRARNAAFPVAHEAEQSQRRADGASGEQRPLRQQRIEHDIRQCVHRPRRSSRIGVCT